MESIPYIPPLLIPRWRITIQTREFFSNRDGRNSELCKAYSTNQQNQRTKDYGSNNGYNNKNNSNTEIFTEYLQLLAMKMLFD
jgi:hypothetical protein